MVRLLWRLQTACISVVPEGWRLLTWQERPVCSAAPHAVIQQATHGDLGTPAEGSRPDAGSSHLRFTHQLQLSSSDSAESLADPGLLISLPINLHTEGRRDHIIRNAGHRAFLPATSARLVHECGASWAQARVHPSVLTTSV